MKIGSNVYEIYHVERRKERGVTMEKNILQFMLYMTNHGKRNSRWTSFIVVVVVDNSKRMAILLFMHSSSFTKRTCLMKIRNVSLTRDITARMLQIPV